MTTGILLQRLVNEDKYLRNTTHLLLDEVHERDVDTDFTLVILKHLLTKESFKLVLMSATAETRLFANYFATESIAQVTGQEVYQNTLSRSEVVSTCTLSLYAVYS